MLTNTLYISKFAITFYLGSYVATSEDGPLLLQLAKIITFCTEKIRAFPIAISVSALLEDRCISHKYQSTKIKNNKELFLALWRLMKLSSVILCFRNLCADAAISCLPAACEHNLEEEASLRQILLPKNINSNNPDWCGWIATLITSSSWCIGESLHP